ncbi:MAG: hypothetical protein CM15mP93_17260 [Thiotrichaceae bacterium]|nr:MAG: hypothetical protein CM15mP93_17260 [Thiotrichaceae bacterium]
MWDFLNNGEIVYMGDITETIQFYKNHMKNNFKDKYDLNYRSILMTMCEIC